MNLEYFKIEELGFSLAYVFVFSQEKKVLSIGLDGTPYKNAVLKIANWSHMEMKFSDDPLGILSEKWDEILNRLHRIHEIRGGTWGTQFYLKGLFKGPYYNGSYYRTIECHIEITEISLTYENRLDALFEAVKEDNLPAIKQLIEGGIDLNHPRMFGVPRIGGPDYIATTYALIEAAKLGNFEVTQLLVEKGADVNLQSTYDGETPLICAFYCRDPQRVNPIVEYLVDCGANINAVGGWCTSALMQAVSMENQEMVKFLVSRGADVNIEVCIDENETRSTPLHAAIFEKRTSMTELLISLGARLDLEDSLGMLPLLTAIEVGSKEICSILLKAGANINQPDYAGETPLQLALRNNNAEMAEFLKEHGAKIIQKIDEKFY